MLQSYVPYITITTRVVISCYRAEARDPQGANKNGERLGDGGCHRKYAAEWDAEWKYAMEHFDEIIEDLRTSNHIWFG